jgi:hypothetical protein
MQSYDGGHAREGQIEHTPGAWSQVQPVAQAHYAPADLSPLDVAQWLLHVEGGDVVGPVSALQIARGIRAGRVPSDASIQAVGDVFWTGLFDEPVVVAALKSL